MTNKDWPRFIITAAIVIMFGGALAFKYSTGLEETLKAVVMLAVGYWLGSSKGSSDKQAAIDELSSLPKEVQVVNDENNAVPVEPRRD